MTDEEKSREAMSALEPLEEVLEQVSEQALRVNHIDAALKDIAHSITDLGEVTHTGLIEIRGLVAASGQGNDPLTEGWQHAVNERLEDLEVRSRRSEQRVLIVIVLLAMLVVLGLLTLAASTGAWTTKKKSEGFDFVPPSGAAATVAPAPPPAAVTAPLDPLPREPATKATKRRARHP